MCPPGPGGRTWRSSWTCSSQPRGGTSGGARSKPRSPPETRSSDSTKLGAAQTGPRPPGRQARRAGAGCSRGHHPCVAPGAFVGPSTSTAGPRSRPGTLFAGSRPVVVAGTPAAAWTLLVSGTTSRILVPVSSAAIAASRTSRLADSWRRGRRGIRRGSATRGPRAVAPASSADALCPGRTGPAGRLRRPPACPGSPAPTSSTLRGHRRQLDPGIPEDLPQPLHEQGTRMGRGRPRPDRLPHVVYFAGPNERGGWGGVSASHPSGGFTGCGAPGQRKLTPCERAR